MMTGKLPLILVDKWNEIKLAVIVIALFKSEVNIASNNPFFTIKQFFES